VAGRGGAGVAAEMATTAGNRDAGVRGRRGSSGQTGRVDLGRSARRAAAMIGVEVTAARTIRRDQAQAAAERLYGLVEPE
jgi:hypothetical protein